ncbi:hypothetical protein Scep_015148 [Stephania cephalantha]|uniref:Uncharacterized protein n=1 Tax=Stephania cephalantha TaxID=152367 RepID=A0AAP0J4S8_9MAGN
MAIRRQGNDRSMEASSSHTGGEDRPAGKLPERRQEAIRALGGDHQCKVGSEQASAVETRFARGASGGASGRRRDKVHSTTTEKRPRVNVPTTDGYEPRRRRTADLTCTGRGDGCEAVAERRK